ncbi:MAG: phosphate uptake regulator PhoU [Nitrososphaerales archaeon]
MVRRLMDLGLSKLTNLMQDMAELSENSVSVAIEAYLSDKNVVTTISNQSNELIMLQEEVSDLAVELLVRYQPVAADLRFIKACMEISYGFARFGRYAYDIAQVRDQFGKLSDCDHSMVANTADEVKKMIRDSIKAFNERDANVAEELRQADDIVDSFYRQNIKRILEGEIEIKCAISAALILRYLERIADHAVYISDLVKYIVSGEKSSM